MLLPTEDKFLRVLTFTLYTMMAIGTGLLIAALGMSLGGCAKNPPETPVSVDSRESLCMREAAKRVTESSSCQESYLSLLSLGSSRPECAIYFARGSVLMAVLVCESTYRAINPRQAVTALSSSKAAPAENVSQ